MYLTTQISSYDMYRKMRSGVKLDFDYRVQKNHICLSYDDGNDIIVEYYIKELYRDLQEKNIGDLNNSCDLLELKFPISGGRYEMNRFFASPRNFVRYQNQYTGMIVIDMTEAVSHLNHPYIKELMDYIKTTEASVKYVLVIRNQAEPKWLNKLLRASQISFYQTVFTRLNTEEFMGIVNSEILSLKAEINGYYRQMVLMNSSHTFTYANVMDYIEFISVPEHQDVMIHADEKHLKEILGVCTSKTDCMQIGFKVGE